MSSSTVLQKNRDGSSSNSLNRQAAGLSAILMLNNVSYIRRELLLNSNVPDLLASGGGIASKRGSTSTIGQGGAGSVSAYGGDVNIEDELNKRHRQAKSSYLEIFSPLVSCLMDAGMNESHSTSSALKNAIGGGHSQDKKDKKDRFTRFNESLEEIENIHKFSRLDKNEFDLRERVKDEIIRMCLPTYTNFVKRNDNFSKSEFYLSLYHI